MKKRTEMDPLAIPRREALALLKSALSARKNLNRRYSLRSYARDLGISPALLSLVLNDKRDLSAEQILRIRTRLGTEASTPQTTVDRRDPASYLSPEFAPISPHEELSQWYELAVLDYFMLDSGPVEIATMSKALRLSPAVTLDAVEKLIRLGLLHEKDGELKKSRSKLTIRTQSSLPSIRNIHRGFIQKALDELSKTSPEAFEKRRISGTTLAINPKHLEEAKHRVDAFQHQLTDFLTRGKCTELYQLNVQFFPLSED